MQTWDVAWGVECKVSESQDPDSQMRLVKKAARQIQPTDLDRGVIAVNLTSALDHTRFSESISTYNTTMYNPEGIQAELQRQVEALIQPYSAADFAGWMKERRRSRAIFFHADAIALAGKTVAMITYQNWFDLHHPGPNPLIVPFRWPEEDDRAMAAVFDADSEKNSRLVILG